MSEYIEKLTEAISAVHECRCSHFGTEHVKEEHEGEIVWDGDVEIFQLMDHPEANVAYGWGWDTGEGEIAYIGILNLPPIGQARDAVRAAIASGSY